MTDRNTLTQQLASLQSHQPSHPLVATAQQKLLSSASSYLPDDAILQLSDACAFADVAHIADRRKSGEPYVTHPIAVAGILAGFKLDVDTLIAAILHDTIEDTVVNKADIINRYNRTVATLVDGVTKLKSSTDKKANKAATFRKILTATLSDPRVLIIKLADRLHNMSTLDAVRLEKRQATAQETLEFYIPFARITGLNELADHIEMLCYMNLDLAAYDKLTNKLTETTLSRSHQQTNIKSYFSHVLTKLDIAGVVQVIDNRINLYRQFFRNRGDATGLVSCYAFEIVVNTISDCDRLADYLIHKYHINSTQIEDHIRKPFAGGNQSLKLTYKTGNETIELTILTQRMLDATRFGVILGDTAPEMSRSVIQASFRNLRELVDDECALTTFDALMDYLHQKKVLCYTPNGDLHELPIGATVLDFAYAINTHLGNNAIGAVVDGKPTKLATPLKSGQHIEILRDPLAVPNPEWLGFIVTSKARRALQEWLRGLTDEEQILHGQEALNRALTTHGYKLTDISPTGWENILAWQGCNHKHDLFKQIATGGLLPQLVVTRLFNQQVTNTSAEQLIANTDGVEIHFSVCCNPIYGDPIVGHLTRRGLMIHRHKCHSIVEARKQNPYHVIQVNWQKDLQTHPRFGVVLQIQQACSDEQISDMLYRLRKINIGINDIYSTNKQTYAYLIVRSRSHVAQAIRELRSLLGFPNIRRLYQYH